MPEQTVPAPTELIEETSATAEFKASFEEFLKKQSPNDRIDFGAGNPPVKVLRALCGLFENCNGLAIDRVEVDGRSGCSDYRGRISVNGGEKEFAFVWDCAWKAREAGLTDFLGFPDQQRAVRQYNYRCFERFEEIR